MTASVKNWSKFQHFKDRRPPWIKLYRDILDDMEWFKLDPVAAKALVMLWLIASEDDGRLPDVETLAFRLRKSNSEIETIISKLSHWLEQSDNSEVSPRYQADTPERETEEEKETEGEAAAAASARPPTRKKKATQLPADFGVSDRVRTWAAEHGFGQLDEHLEAFKLKATAKAYTYVSWDDAFMGAIRDDWAKTRSRPTTFAQQAADIARTTVPAKPGKDPTLIALEEHAEKTKPPTPEQRQQIQEAIQRMRA